MKKSIILLLFALCVSSAFAQKPVKKWGQLQVISTQLCDQYGRPVVLRGVSFGWHNIWPRFYNKGAVKTLVNDWHASVIRAAMGIKIEDNYLENPSFAKECIENVVKAAIKNDVYVIMDWHAHETYTKEAKEWFGYFAKKYGKYPHIIYEIFNEPVDQSWDSLKDYAREVITEIRKYDPDNVVLVGCPHWDQDIDVVAAAPLTGFDNIMYTVHFYAATHGSYLRNKMVEAHKTLPIFVSECAGMEASGNGPLNEEEWQKWTDVMEQERISWVNWSLSDKDETCSMLLPRAKADGNWPDDVIKIYGKKVKNNLLKYNK